MLDHTGKEEFLTESCCMDFLFDKESCCLPEENVAIYIYRKSRRKSISIEKFKKILSTTNVRYSWGISRILNLNSVNSEFVKRV